MDQVDVGNPYQAPEAPISALRAEIRRPPVYTAISLFCWVLGAFFFVLFGLFMYFISTELGWKRVAHSASSGPKILLFASLIFICTLSYISAGRLLWIRRGRPGLILCVLAIMATYLSAWLYTSMLNRPPRRVSNVRILPPNSTTDRLFLTDPA